MGGRRHGLWIEPEIFECPSVASDSHRDPKFWMFVRHSSLKILQRREAVLGVREK